MKRNRPVRHRGKPADMRSLSNDDLVRVTGGSDFNPDSGGEFVGPVSGPDKYNQT